ncbi:MAG TPA: polyphosphate kinase 1 [Pyrinomonadaceae bacterium]|jgi:polyphosphate kinase|nr:polyphosphate kinase 1 [Pyrinomonadaceae bacterium]
MNGSTNTQPSDDERAEPTQAKPPQTRRDAALPLFNRELSQIEFYRRVLEEAQDPTQPLLERLKFLSIFSENLDEFFMIRVSGLQETLGVNLTEPSPDGMGTVEQLKEIRARLLPLVAEHARCLREEVLPRLAEKGIRLVEYSTLSLPERQSLREFFKKKVYPVLTPQAVDQGHPFPYISNLSLNLALTVEPLAELGITRSLTGKVEPRFARVKVPPLVPRLVPVGEAKYVLLEQVIAANVAQLFPRMQVSECHAFRVTRDADVEIREDEANDLLRMMEQTLRKRRFGTPVRLEVAAEMPEAMRVYLSEALDLTAADVYAVEGPLGARELMQLHKLDRPDLKDEPFRPKVPAVFRGPVNYFDRIRERDVILHHPFESYTLVTDFIDSAAHDPQVAAIKICLYRTGQHSPIPQSLIEASAQGKQVTALVELKARFDEENNIEWAKRLEESGVHVVYGIVGLKTHCKLTLVVRREGESLRRYVHVATGNYNPVTSNFYTDIGLFTADEEIGEDATDLFNFLTGFSRQKEYRKLWVAPSNLREKTLTLIRREAEHARAGRPARIVIKINRLADTQLVGALYEASRAGVEIDLIVRGICMLRAGVPGLSETIRVRSVVGRFLEHSRAYYFANGGDDELYTGSSDWMSRNFDRRVEVIAPVRDERLKKYLKDVLLSAYLRDNVKARVLRPDGSYERARVEPGEEPFDSQSYFIDAPEPE